MPKGTMLDRLAGAMKTLGKREGKTLTPRQRVAAAQRWNSLADIGDDELDRLYRISENGAAASARDYDDAHRAVANIGTIEPEGNRADNPFLSDNIDKYAEQSDFLDWCRYNRLEPNGRNLKQFRWETYQTLPYTKRQYIANKDDILRALYDDDYVTPYDEFPVYKSFDEFPDDFDYMWRY